MFYEKELLSKCVHAVEQLGVDVDSVDYVDVHTGEVGIRGLEGGYEPVRLIARLDAPSGHVTIHYK